MDSLANLDNLDLTYTRVRDDEMNKDETNQDHPIETKEPTDDVNVNNKSNTLNLQSILDNLNRDVANLTKDASLIIDKKLVSRGIWDAKCQNVNIISNKGLKQYIPHFSNNCHYLNPLEALFMMECRALSISFEGILLSLEDAYKLLLHNKRDTLLYRIFAILSRNGYFVYQFIKNSTSCDDLILETQSRQSNLKRTLDDCPTELPFVSKKPNILSTTQNEKNYKAITSIRPLSLSHLPKLTRIDKKLIACSIKESSSDKLRSFLYCVRNSSVPVDLNKKLQPLHCAEIKPLVDFSAVYSTDQLFDLIKNAGPRSLSNEQFENRYHGSERDFYFEIDFKVFSSQKQLANHSHSQPLFVVVVVDETDPFPSVADIVHLQKLYSSSLFFALVSPSLDFNFYSFERLSLNDEYPNLWEKHFSRS